MGWDRSAQWTGPSMLPQRFHPAAKLLPGLLARRAALAMFESSRKRREPTSTVHTKSRHMVQGKCRYGEEPFGMRRESCAEEYALL
jgi:hypothetical protein